MADVASYEHQQLGASRPGTPVQQPHRASDSRTTMMPAKLKQLLHRATWLSRSLKGTNKENSMFPESRKSSEASASCSTAYSTAIQVDRANIAKLIAEHLTNMLDEACSLPAFEGDDLPVIGLLDYVERLMKYADAWAGDKAARSPISTGVNAALVAVEYLDRLNRRFSPRSIHRLYMCAVLVALKFTEDYRVSSNFWAKVGGVEPHELNRMECAFCELLEWKLSVTQDDFMCQQDRFAETYL